MHPPAAEPVRIPSPPVALAGDLTVPAAAGGLVVFAHGAGSSRLSPRNQGVAHALAAAGLATLLFDLLTAEEDRDYETRFDIALLTRRLHDAVRWTAGEPRLARLPVGLFGASTGAAAALCVAAAEPRVAAVVSRGGRPDLAGRALGRVRAPTLLIVGGDDSGVIELNEAARDSLSGPRDLVLVPGATHLFEEPGALEQVSRLAVEWFRRHLQATAR